MGSIYTLNQALDKVQELYDKRYTLEEAIKIVKKGYEESDQTIPSNHNQNNQEQYTTKERFRQTIRDL